VFGADTLVRNLIENYLSGFQDETCGRTKVWA